MTRILPIVPLLALLATPAWAAYRVYYLKLSHLDSQGKPERVEMVLSTLDPVQYEHYYSGFRRMKIEMVNTWYCPGDTGNRRKYCDPPKTGRTPASVHDKRVEINRQPYIPK